MNRKQEAAAILARLDEVISEPVDWKQISELHPTERKFVRSAEDYIEDRKSWERWHRKARNLTLALLAWFLLLTIAGMVWWLY